LRRTSRVYSAKQRACCAAAGASPSRDIITEKPCRKGRLQRRSLGRLIGGAAQARLSVGIEAAGLAVQTVEENRQYQFISDQAKGATSKWGVKSVSIIAASSDFRHLEEANGGNDA